MRLDAIFLSHSLDLPQLFWSGAELYRSTVWIQLKVFISSHATLNYNCSSPFKSFGFKFHFSVVFFLVLLIKIQIHRITPTLYLNCIIPTGCIVWTVFILTEFNMEITSTLSLVSTYTLSTCCKIPHSNQMQCNACVSSTVYLRAQSSFSLLSIVICIENPWFVQPYEHYGIIFHSKRYSIFTINVPVVVVVGLCILLHVSLPMICYCCEYVVFFFRNVLFLFFPSYNISRTNWNAIAKT